MNRTMSATSEYFSHSGTSPLSPNPIMVQPTRWIVAESSDIIRASSLSTHISIFDVLSKYQPSDVIIYSATRHDVRTKVIYYDCMQYEKMTIPTSITTVHSNTIVCNVLVQKTKPLAIIVIANMYYVINTSAWMLSLEPINDNINF